MVYRADVPNPPAQTRKREAALGFDTSQRYLHALHGFAARLTGPQLAALRNDPSVAAVVPDRPVHADSVPVAAGETVPAGITRVGSAGGGQIRQASDVAVAEIDTGIDLSNPDLNVAAGTNCVDSSKPPQDDNGHGTHVAGTIAARNDGEGVVGVAPGTQLYAVKVLNNNGSGNDSQVICGLDWVAAHAAALGIKVVNMSLGGTGPAGTCGSDPEHGAVCDLTAAGVTVVAAAGNDGAAISAATGSHLPAAYPEVLTVTAFTDTDGQPGGLGPADCSGTPDDRADSFSNYAAAGDQSHTIAAPGGCVVSLDLFNPGGLKQMSGTSMASPHVAGATALCIDEAGTGGPCAGQTPAEIIQTMRTAAQAATGQATGFLGDPLHPLAHYYGYLARATVGPAATTGAAQVVDDNDATLAGTVDANGGGASWWWELGTDPGNYDIQTPVASGSPGADPVAVQGDAEGLDAGTQYHYRMVVQSDGWVVHGADETFTTTGTPPPPPPDTTIDSAPALLTSDPSARVDFSGTPGGDVTGYECNFDGAGWSACSPPFTDPQVPEGSHTFQARAIGVGGRKDPSPASVSWTVDTTPPETQISGHPVDPTSSTSASFGMAASEPATFECRLDGAAWASCPATERYDGLAAGPHTFQARATDVVGLTDSTPASFNWTVSVPSSAPGPSQAATPPAVEPPANPLTPNPVTIDVPQRAVLAVGSPARLGRRDGRIRLSLACSAAAPCAGRLVLTSSGRRLSAIVVRLRAGAHATRTLRLSRSARRRLGSRPVAIRLSLAAAPATQLARSTLRLLT